MKFTPAQLNRTPDRLPPSPKLNGELVLRRTRKAELRAGRVCSPGFSRMSLASALSQDSSPVQLGRLKAELRTGQRGSAFTLAELLVVIAIISILAVIGLPALKSLNRSGGIAGAQRQLLDDIARARHLAIVNRTPVYMVFVPPDLDGFLRSGTSGYSTAELSAMTNLLVGQFTSYNFVALRGVGDQPGRGKHRYFDQWRSLPDGIFIPPEKFTTPTNITIADPKFSNGRIQIPRFQYSTNLPIRFPFSTSQVFTYNNFGNPDLKGLPYLAFNAQGQMISDPKEAFVPLALGAVIVMRGADGTPTGEKAEVLETPPGGSRDSYNLIQVNGMTGQGRYVTRELP